METMFLTYQQKLDPKDVPWNIGKVTKSELMRPDHSIDRLVLKQHIVFCSPEFLGVNFAVQYTTTAQVLLGWKDVIWFLITVLFKTWK